MKCFKWQPFSSEFSHVARLFSAAIAAAMLSACMEDMERPEIITKFRTLGVSTEPPAFDRAAPGDLELTIYFAVNSDEDIEITSFDDSQSGNAARLEAEIDAQSAQRDEHAGFDIYSVKASIEADAIRSALASGADADAGELRYAFVAKQGSEEEKIVGTLVALPLATELSAVRPDSAEITIVEPAQTAVSGEADVRGSLADGDFDKLRLAWFASSGKIINRRSLSTKWTDIAQGPQTLVLTARGSASGFFAIIARDYQSQ